jgi:DNA replication licensing factor MCM7
VSSIFSSSTALFRSFLQQHTILTVVDQQNPLDSDDDDNLEPMAGAHSVRRVPCFPPLLQRIKDRHYYPNAPSNTFVVEIPLSELEAWDAVRGRDLAERATKNATRYHDIFCHCIDTALENARQQSQADAGGGVDGGHLEESGLLNEDGNNNTPGGATEDFPPLLMRRYELRILPLGRSGTLPPFFNQYRPKRNENKDDSRSNSGVSLRTVRSKDMGHLVTIRGMIVRASDVKPSCVVATYSCDNCGCEVYQLIENKREFMPLRLCPSQECLARPKGQRLDSLHLQTRGSKFVKFQELKLQELPNQVP